MLDTFRLTLTMLTPLHVGSGTRLREGFDFIEHNGYLWIANQSALLDAVLPQSIEYDDDFVKIAREAAKMTLYDMLAAGWLKPEHFDLNNGIFGYRLAGETSTKEKKGELQEFIKDVFGNPYLPGTSLKGALRSIFMRQLARESKHKPLIFYEERYNHRSGTKILKANEKKAAEFEEGFHFVPNSPLHTHRPKLDPLAYNADQVYSGFAVTNPSRRHVDAFHNPNYDLWRAVHVIDSIPVSVSDLVLAKVQILPISTKPNAKKQETLDMDVEVLPADIHLEMRIQIDPWLFEDARAKKLQFSQEQYLQFTSRLIEIANNDALDRLRAEATYLGRLQREMDSGVAQQFKTTSAILSTLADEYNHLQKNEILIQMGKGTGWLSKTLGQVLIDGLSDQEFTQLVQDFVLGRGKWRRNGLVPVTHQLATAGKQVRAPLGWIKIKVEPVG